MQYLKYKRHFIFYDEMPFVFFENFFAFLREMFYLSFRTLNFIFGI